MDSSKDSYCSLKLGPVTLGMRFDDQRNTQAMAEYFSTETIDSSPDLLLDFTLVEHEEFPDIPQSLIQAKRWEGDSFTIAGDLITGRNTGTESKWEIEVKTILTRGQITRVFEQFLYQAFYSACVKSGKAAFLLHSSGVSVEGKGFLFVGPSGMGKSTVAELSRAYEVINDEMNILGPDECGGYCLYPSPFNAYFKHKAKGDAPLKAIFLLRHDTFCHVEKISTALAVAEITGQVVPPLGLEDAFTPAVASRMMGIAHDIVTAVPVYLLYFPVEGGFWPLISDMFP